MDRIIIEELLRSVATLFFALMITIFLIKQFGLPASFFTIIGIPLVITGVIFSLFVYKRKTTGKEYKLKTGTTPYKVMTAIFTLACLVFIISGIRTIAYGNTLMGFFWTGLGIFGVVSGFREFRKTK